MSLPPRERGSTWSRPHRGRQWSDKAAPMSSEGNVEHMLNTSHLKKGRLRRLRSPSKNGRLCPQNPLWHGSKSILRGPRAAITAGFEDQERHQIALRLRNRLILPPISRLEQTKTQDPFRLGQWYHGRVRVGKSLIGDNPPGTRRRCAVGRPGAAAWPSAGAT